MNKRTMSNDALDTLGTIIGENEKRDAVHLAVEPVVAGEFLEPGMHVGFLPNGTVGVTDKLIGIVDPFLQLSICEGERFWLIVYPREITSLCHMWTHPAFDDKPGDKSDGNEGLSDDKKEAYLELQRIAAEINVTVIDLINRAKEYLESGLYWIQGDRFEGVYFDTGRFWNNFATYTGIAIEEDEDAHFLGCSC